MAATRSLGPASTVSARDAEPTTRRAPSRPLLAAALLCVLGLLAPPSARAQNLHALRPHDSAITVMWSGTDYGGGWHVEWRHEFGVWKGARTRIGPPFTIENLFNGERYQVRIRNITSAGMADDPGNTRSAVPRADADVPATPAPPVLTATASPAPGRYFNDFDLARIQVSWTAPASASSITRYTLQWRRPELPFDWGEPYGHNTVNLDPTTTSYEIDKNLFGGTSYDVRLAAHSAIGRSYWSVSSIVTSGNAGPAGEDDSDNPNSDNPDSGGGNVGQGSNPNVAPFDELPRFDESAIGDVALTVGRPVRIELPAASGGNGELAYALAPELPAGLSFNAEARTIWGMPVEPGAGAAYVYRATDADETDPDSEELGFSISVEAALVGADDPEFVAAPAGETSVSLVWRGPWAEAPPEEVTIEARSLDHGWMDWRPVGEPPANEAGVVGRLIDGLEAESPYTFRLRRTTPGGEVTLSPERSAMTGAFGGPCRDGDGYLCVRDGRFEVQAQWANPADPLDFGRGTAVPTAISDESGLFWFFNEDNVELAVKVLDGRWLNEHFWVYYGALSDLEYWVTVNDTASGATRTYRNPPKQSCGRGDIHAFETSGLPGTVSGSSSAGPSAGPGDAWWKQPGFAAVDLAAGSASSFGAASAPPRKPALSCEPAGDRLCLGGGRFAVEVDFVDPNVENKTERLKRARVIPSLTTAESGLFWFFDAENFELAVKVLDGQKINGRFWFLYGGLSDVEYTIRLIDTTTGMEREYVNPQGSLCGGIDTNAL